MAKVKSGSKKAAGMKPAVVPAVEDDEVAPPPEVTESTEAIKSSVDDYFSMPVQVTKPSATIKVTEVDDEEPAVEDDEPVTDKPKVVEEAPEQKERKTGPKASPTVSASGRRIVALPEETRKLTKKAQSLLAEWHGKNRTKKVDSFFAGHAKRMRTQFGHSSCYLGSETDNLVIGIPCPALAFEYVIAQDCFPLGLVMHLVAKAGTGKSALLAEFGRWFDLAGGGMNLFENETKFNPLWYRSIMGDDMYDNRCELHRCNSVEDWQRHLTAAVKDMKQFSIGTKEDPGPGRTLPILFGVDSIMGKQSEELQEKIVGTEGEGGKKGAEGEGFAPSRYYAIEAGSISKYMRTIPQLMDNWPFALVLINHLRLNQDDSGNQVRNKSGGEQLNFQESFEIEIKKVGGHKKMISCAEFDGYPVEISCEKNSFGPTHRKIQTRIIWWEEKQEDGSWKQKTVWDWDWSTVHLLDSHIRGEKANPRLKANLAEIDFHLECPKRSDVENLAWSKSLGMKSEKEALPWCEIGALIRTNPELMDRLRKALRINARPLLKGDYLKQIEGLAELMP